MYGALYDEQDVSRKVLGSAIIFSAVNNVLDKVYGLLYDVYLNRGPGADLLVVNTAIIHRNTFALPYLYGILCTSKNEVLESSRDAFTYGDYLSDSQALKFFGEKSMDSS